MNGTDPSRAELGRLLAATRLAAGYSQQRLGARIGYSRGAVSNAETGRGDVARAFWAACDKALGAEGQLIAACEHVRAAERPPAGAPHRGGGRDGDWQEAAWQQAASPEYAVAASAYGQLGWKADVGEDRIDLLTGDPVDALELPLAAGLLAVSLWRYTLGRADEIRRLPALPDPGRAMAVITAADRCYFLAASGGSPWDTGADATTAAPGLGQAASGRGCGPVIRWHGAGSRVPAPPSRLPGGGQAAWAHLPADRPFLVPAVALLGLLATAMATAGATRPRLTLPGGVSVIPARTEAGH